MYNRRGLINMAVVSGEIFSVENDSNSVDTGTLDEPVLVTVVWCDMCLCVRYVSVYVCRREI